MEWLTAFVHVNNLVFSQTPKPIQPGYLSVGRHDESTGDSYGKHYARSGSSAQQ